MDNEQYLKDMAEAEKRAKQTELEQAKAEALKKVQIEQDKTMPIFQKQKQQVNVQSQLGAKNFAEYWANRGQSFAGINAQEQLSRANILGRDIGTINSNETQALTDFANQRAGYETAYQNNLINSNNTIDANLQTNLYNEKVRQQERQQAIQDEYRRVAIDRQQAEYQAGLDAAEDRRNSQVQTDYYTGDINPNTKYGVFETLSNNGVKYQPNNVGQYTYFDKNTGKNVKATNTLSKYKSNGKAITVGDYAKATGKKIIGSTGADVSKQNVWVDKLGRAWYWDGSINDYRAL